MGRDGREGSFPGGALALPPHTHTWQQLLAQGSATLPVTGSQLCTCLERWQGQAFCQDVGLGIGARVQLGSKQRGRVLV